MSRYRDPQLQVTENLCDMRNLGPNISLFQDLKNILLLTTDYTGANTHCNTIVYISVLSVTFNPHSAKSDYSRF